MTAEQIKMIAEADQQWAQFVEWVQQTGIEKCRGICEWLKQIVGKPGFMEGEMCRIDCTPQIMWIIATLAHFGMEKALVTILEAPDETVGNKPPGPQPEKR